MCAGLRAGLTPEEQPPQRQAQRNEAAVQMSFNLVRPRSQRTKLRLLHGRFEIVMRPEPVPRRTELRHIANQTVVLIADRAVPQKRRDKL